MDALGRRSIVWLAGALVMGLMITACGGGEPTAAPTRATQATAVPTVPSQGGAATAVPTQSASQQPAATPTPSRSAFEQQWEKLVADAKKEGEVSILLGGSARRLYNPVIDVFEKEYGIKADRLGGSTSQLTDRILAERSAGRFTLDVAMGGSELEARWIPAGALDTFPSQLLLPEVADPSLWAGGHHWYREFGKYIFLYSGNVQLMMGGPWYNKNLVTADDLAGATSVWEFVDPKWKGKIAAAIPLPEGSTMGNFYAHPEMGREWLLKFITEMDVAFVEDVRLLSDGIARGKYAWGLNLGKANTELATMRDQGLPVDEVEPYMLTNDLRSKERPTLSTGSSGNNLAVVNRRPHPAAAQLFINWYLSKDGQTAMQNLAETAVDPTLRLDVPFGGKAQGLSVSAVPSDLTYIFIDGDPELKAKADEGDAIAIQLWEFARRRR